MFGRDANQKTLPVRWVDVFLVFCLAFLVTQFMACTSVPQVTPPTPKYQLLLSGLVDNRSFIGTAIGTDQTQHQMTIKSTIPVDYFTMQSCHRSLQFSNVIQFEWYDWSTDNKSFTWTYNQSPTIEDNGDCILRFCAFSKKVGSPPVACAVVDFHNAKYTLPSENICNGTDAGPNTSLGTSICHTQVGLIERMRFSGSVVTARQVTDPAGKVAPYSIPDQCSGKFLDANQTLFEYQVPEKECTIVFMEKALPHRRAKLTVVPYDSAIYPGGNN